MIKIDSRTGNDVEESEAELRESDSDDEIL